MQRSLLLLCIALLPAMTLAQSLDPIVSEGVVDAPPALVWDAWTTTEGLHAWLAPHVEIDLRVGGLMRTNYNPNASLDDPQTIANEVLSYDPGKMLSIRVKQAPANFPFPKAIYDMWTVMYFDAVGDNQTRLRVVGLGFDASEESQNMRNFFTHGNAQTIEALRKHFAANP